jgi:flavin reductase (DIM6/NTAB) family NADH-FMN oxidoreductase RutF
LEIRPETLDRRSRYSLMISVLVPRPIAWISTVSAAGERNLAPFSYFGGIAANPPLMGISIGRRRGAKKDSLSNLEETGEVVVHIPTRALAEKMVLSSGDYPPEIDEFDLTGLTPIPSTIVRPPRIAEAPVAMECRVERILELGDDPEGFVIARVLVLHLHDDILEEGRVKQERLQAIGRLGGAEYCTVDRVFAIERPNAERELDRWRSRSERSRES